MRKNLYLQALTVVVIIICLLALSGCASRQYNVNFYDGDNVIHIEKVDKLTNVPDLPERTGYQFSGWYFDNQYLQPFALHILKEMNLVDDIHVYAKWTPIVYNINYELAGGVNSENNPQTYTIESCGFVLENPVKENSVFLGWYSGQELVAEIPQNSTGDITLTARWQDYDYVMQYDKELTELENGEKLTQIIDGAESGTTIYIEAGEYVFDKTLIINKSLSIIGDGKDTTVLRMMNDIGTMFITVGGQDKKIDFVLKRLHIDGYRMTSSNNNSALRIGSSTYLNTEGSLIVEQCRFTNFTKNSITVYGGDCVINDNEITVLQVSGSAGNGIQVDMGATATITDNVISSAVSSAEQWASGGVIVLRGAKAHTVTGNTLSNCNIGICLETYYDGPQDITELDKNAEKANKFTDCTHNVYRRTK